MQKYKSQWGTLVVTQLIKTLEHFLMDAQCSPNDLQRHKVLSGASDLVYKPLYQSGHLVFLCGQRCLEGEGERRINNNLQWNLSIVDTIGNQHFVSYSKVSLT